MATRLRAFRSSVGTKLLIGITGLALFLYLITHILGNVLVFAGRDTFNQYSHMLLSNPLIPVIEIGLVVIFILHIYKTVTMYLANLQARPARYAVKKPAGAPSRKSFASSTMIFSGLWLLAFVVIHVRQFKYGAEYAAPGSGIRDLYRLEMENFANPLLVVFYVLSMLVVGSHLWHGIASAFQSLGADQPRWTPRVLTAGKLFAVLIAAGFIVIALWAHFLGARSCRWTRTNRPARSPRNGTGTSSR
jgi:succinate dehydrogenase / fumarate reductase cytochrome b subunit